MTYPLLCQARARNKPSSQAEASGASSVRGASLAGEVQLPAETVPGPAAVAPLMHLWQSLRGLWEPKLPTESQCPASPLVLDLASGLLIFKENIGAAASGSLTAPPSREELVPCPGVGCSWGGGLASALSPMRSM
jgi:hypothetical protein